MIPVKIGAPQSHDGLTLLPLFPADDRARSQPPWTLLSDALEDGSLEYGASPPLDRLQRGRAAPVPRLTPTVPAS